VHWHPTRRAVVWWLDHDTTRHEAPRAKVKVWAYISTYRLWRDLQAAATHAGPRTLAEALQRWRREDIGAALAYLGAAQDDLKVIALAAKHLNTTPNHSFVYNPKNPAPDKHGGWVALGYDDLNTSTNLKTLAGQMTLTAATFGDDGKYAELITAYLEYKPDHGLHADLKTIEADIDLLSYALEVTRHHDLPAQSRVVKRHLPPEYRKKCANQQQPTHWFAALRSDAKFCSDACRQAAYRQRREPL
jgi:hypothetical protein